MSLKSVALACLFTTLSSTSIEKSEFIESPSGSLNNKTIQCIYTSMREAFNENNYDLKSIKTTPQFMNISYPPGSPLMHKVDVTQVLAKAQKNEKTVNIEFYFGYKEEESPLRLWASNLDLTEEQNVFSDITQGTYACIDQYETLDNSSL